jgi:hypothetical protein
MPSIALGSRGGTGTSRGQNSNNPAYETLTDSNSTFHKPLKLMARETGLEPATSGVTGRRSNQLSYSPATRRYDGRTGRLPDRIGQRSSQALYE